jgi:hypothetical protein
MEAVHLRAVWPDVARQATIAMEVTGQEAGRFAGLAHVLRSACRDHRQYGSRRDLVSLCSDEEPVIAHRLLCRATPPGGNW